MTGLELNHELQEILSNAYECGVGFKVFDVEELIEVFPFIEDISLERSKKETK